jgi:hypothetical protein
MAPLNWLRWQALGRSALLGVLGLSTACGSPSVGELEESEVSLTVTAVASAPDVAAVGDAQGGLGVSRAFLSASAVTLVPCLADAGSVPLGARGYELLAQPPASERVTTAVSKLCGVQLDIDAVDATTSADLAPGTTLYVEARDADGTSITLASEQAHALLLEPEPGESFGDQPLLLGVDVSLWLAGLPLPDDKSDEQAAQFDSQLEDAVALYVDSNGNQALDDDEQTPVAHAHAAR